MNKELSDLLTIPDFERRCDEFVTEVINEVVGDYPELGIYPVNKTREDLVNINPAAIKHAEEHGRSSYLRILDQAQDERSAFQSEGAVEIWGWEGLSAVPQIQEASTKIDAIAKHHGGKKEIFGNEKRSLNIPDLPNAYLIYTFE